MLEASRRRILQTVPDDAVVLDVGGWAVPFPRADWVIDLAPYETRGAWGYDGDPAAERFTAHTYVQRDICGRAPWPFEDGQFDFVICSHTLEDLRDPVWVCSEMVRAGRAGYVEVPSRLVEQCRGVQGDWVGWSHHRWLVDVDPDAADVRFVLKPHELSRRDVDIAFAEGTAARLGPEERVSCLWWEGGFSYREHVFYEVAEQHEYLREAIVARPDLAAPAWRRRRRR